MELNTNDLASALRGEAAAKAQLNAQQAKMEQAQQLVNTAAPTNQNRTIFDALNANMDRQRGREMQSATEPRLKQARARAAQTYGAGQIYSEGVRQENQGYSREQSRLKQAREKRIREQNLTREDEQLATKQTREDSKNAAARTEMRGDPTLFRNDTTGDELNVIMTDNGPVDSQGNRVNLAGFRKVDDANSKNAAYGGRSRAAAEREALNLYNRRSSVDSLASIALEFTDTEIKELQDIRSRLGKKIALAVTPQDFEQVVEGEFEGYTPKIKAFMNELRRGGAQLRNDLFGSALSKNEARSSEGFSSAAGGLSLSDIMLRLGTLDDRTVENLTNLDAAYNEDFSTRRQYETMSAYRRRQKEGEQTLGETVLNSAQNMLDSGQRMPPDDRAALNWILKNGKKDPAKAKRALEAIQKGVGSDG